MIKRLDGSTVNVDELRTQLNKKIRSSVVGYNGQTFADIVIPSIRARQATGKPLRPCDLRYQMNTPRGVRKPTIRRQVNVWQHLVDTGIADNRYSYHTYEDYGSETEP